VEDSVVEEKLRQEPSRTQSEIRATLFTKLGGMEAVKAVVAEMYTRLLADDLTAPFFENTNMAHLKQHQVGFMKIAFTQIPEGLDVPALLIEKHLRLFQEKGLNATHFDRVATHFVGACDHLGVDQELIAEAAEVVGSLRPVFEQGAIDFGSKKAAE
jgi:hemoglobin